MTSEGVDYSFSPPNLGRLKAEGKTFVGRYLPTGSGKDLTPLEAAAIRAAGLDLFLYYESSTGFMLGGFDAGVAAAAHAEGGALSCGIPLRMVYFAADTPLTEPDVDKAIAALDGAASVLGKERTGGYHGTSSSFGAKCVARGYALASAHYGGDPTPGARLHQYQGTTPMAGGSVDLVRALVADYGQCWINEDGGNDVGSITDPKQIDELAAANDAGVTIKLLARKLNIDVSPGQSWRDELAQRIADAIKAVSP